MANQRETREEDYDHRPPRRRRGDTIMGGSMPRWFTVILLGLLVYLARQNFEEMKNTLKHHDARIIAIELWRAAMEGRKN